MIKKQVFIGNWKKNINARKQLAIDNPLRILDRTYGLCCLTNRPTTFGLSFFISY